MQAYLTQGARGGAIRQYQRCRKILRRELSVDPSPETEDLYRRITDGVAVSARLPARERPSIAIMPFDAPQGDEDIYFAQGVVDDILSELSRFRSLRVIARHSSFSAARLGRCGEGDRPRAGCGLRAGGQHPAQRRRKCASPPISAARPAACISRPTAMTFRPRRSSSWKIASSARSPARWPSASTTRFSTGHSAAAPRISAPMIAGCRRCITCTGTSRVASRRRANSSSGRSRSTPTMRGPTPAWRSRTTTTGTATTGTAGRNASRKPSPMRARRPSSIPPITFPTASWARCISIAASSSWRRSITAAPSRSIRTMRIAWRGWRKRIASSAIPPPGSNWARRRGSSTRAFPTGMWVFSACPT